MAYQRPFLISLKRGSQEPWGFRTFGGKEYGEPHVVEKVATDSIAEQCGVREGDEIIQIGRVNVQDCTFGQVQELLARSGNKIEMFVIREDLLSPRKGKEPSHVKAIVHNPYNSPLNLYSTENIAETLAKQTEVLTEGHISSAEEEDAPENLSFKQKSAVFQLLEEQAKQETVNQNFPKQRKAPPPPPPKAPPSSAQYYQNKENYGPQDRVYNSVQSQHQQACDPKENEFYMRKSPTEQHKVVSSYSVQPQKNVSFATTNHYTSEKHQTAEYRSSQRATSTTQNQGAVTAAHQQQSQRIHHQPDFQELSHQQHREKQQVQQSWHPHKQQKHLQSNQQQQEQHMRYQQQQQQEQQRQYQQQQEQHRQYQQQQEQQRQYQPQNQPQKQSSNFQSQQLPQQQMQRQQHYQTQQQYPTQQVHQYDAENNDEAMHPTGSPTTFKAPPTQKNRVNWPPANAAQQNGRWHSPSPTPSSPSKNIVQAAWPPKQPTAKELPKTGFNPAAIKEQGSGRRCVWPPPKPDDEFRSGRSTPQSPVTGRRIAWNPSPSPPLTRRSPFGSASPVTRRKDVSWPPPQPTGQKIETNHSRPSPTLVRRARFDDYVKLHASTNVPSTYRPPPGTQRVEYA